MALSLGWHIIIACFGVGFPLLVLLAEWRWLRTGGEVYRLLAHRWAKTLAVLFAVGAVTGTILWFEFGILWPEFKACFGEVIGLPFALEGFAFFVEAIFLGIYLYGWDRLPPRVHLVTGVPAAGPVMGSTPDGRARRHDRSRSWSIAVAGLCDPAAATAHEIAG